MMATSNAVPFAIGAAAKEDNQDRYQHDASTNAEESGESAHHHTHSHELYGGDRSEDQLCATRRHVNKEANSGDDEQGTKPPSKPAVADHTEEFGANEGPGDAAQTQESGVAQSNRTVQGITNDTGDGNRHDGEK